MTEEQKIRRRYSLVNMEHTYVLNMADFHSVSIPVSAKRWQHSFHLRPSSCLCGVFSPTTRVAGNLQTFMGKIGVEVGGGKRKSAIAQNIPKKVKAVT